MNNWTRKEKINFLHRALTGTHTDEDMALLRIEYFNSLSDEEFLTLIANQLKGLVVVNEIKNDSQFKENLKAAITKAMGESGKSFIHMNDLSWEKIRGIIFEL